ncbi:mammalian ependymin-related protein 1-like [Lingula anatina]|uniref:Mammalian ependymin-related protein 1 n=1 Tax=Lingula anatina TaxID=7574 RepID=A0A1S3HJP2_LINAN|nr:mammalian ependymin-related protein 1 [Lingula anatina]XP_013390489.1 mammalian ependymin-related protein 1-like [Lingula anatina]|eukprot:XP_013386338.1 mammalian ependymin-related protein 1 [Lingula anatina]
MRTLILAVVLLAGIAYSQKPKPCITPPQWASRAFMFDHNYGNMEYIRIVYDAIYRRKIVIEEDVVVRPGRRFYEYLSLNDVHELFKINLKTKECVKMRPRHWRPFGIPPNSTFDNEFEIGGPGEAFTAQQWTDRIPGFKTAEWIGVYSLKYCYPVHETFFNRLNISESNTVNFYDIVAGIPDPDMFIPPPECKTAKWVDETDDLPAYV